MKKRVYPIVLCILMLVLTIALFVFLPNNLFYLLPFKILIGIGVIIMFLLYIEILKRSAQRKKTTDTYSIVTEGLKDGTISNEDDLRKIYEVCGMEDIYGTFASFLEHYLVSLRKKKDNRIQYEQYEEIADGKISFLKINTLLSKIIEKERQEKPYEGVYDRERKLLQDIENAADNNRPSEVKSGLSYLANVLIENQKKHSKENRRNNLITRIGVILTVLGLIATVIIFIVQQNHNLTSRDVKKEMIEVIDSCFVIDTNGIVDHHLHTSNANSK